MEENPMRKVERLTEAQCERAMPVEVMVPASPEVVEAELVKALRAPSKTDRRSRLKSIGRLGTLAGRLDSAPPGYILKYKPRWLIDGDGLALIASSPNNWKPRYPGQERPVYRSWILRWTPGDIVISRTGKARKVHRVLGLGPFPSVSLAQARELANKARQEIRLGQDPALEKKKNRARKRIEEKRLHTLKQAVEEYAKTHASTWTPKHAIDWKTSFGHIKDLLDLPVNNIDRPAVIAAFKDIFQTEVGRRLRGRLYQVLEMATALNWREGENPASWSLLKHSLPNNHKPSKPHPSLNYKDAPEFLRRVQGVEGLRARCVELVVLTGVRVGQVLSMKPEHCDLKNAIWECPAEFTKTGKRSGQNHVVPLSDAALACLKKIEMKPGKPLFDIPAHDPNRLAQKLWPEYPIDCHGFRSTLRTYIATETSYPWEIGESILDHRVAGDVARRYLRTTWIDARRNALQDWSSWLRRG
jgi:integrase